MTYATARARLVQIISEEASPTDKRLYSEAFVHLPEGRSGIACRSRSFWLEANTDGDGGFEGPFTPDLQGQPRMRFSMTLTVSYRAHERRSVMDEVLASDQRLIGIALLTPGYWQSSTSGIISITTDPVYLPTRRVAVNDTTIEQRTSFSLLCR